MRICGWKPTHFTFGGLMSCCWLDFVEGIQSGACKHESRSLSMIFNTPSRTEWLCKRSIRQIHGDGGKPEKVAFLSILSACRHVGLVEQGMNLFSQMKLEYGVEPDIDHYLVVVDLLTRYGRIKEAEQLIS